MRSIYWKKLNRIHVIEKRGFCNGIFFPIISLEEYYKEERRTGVIKYA